MTLRIYINIEIGGCATRTAIMAAAFFFADTRNARDIYRNAP